MAHLGLKGSTWLWLTLVALVLTALLFGFEYLGSEQPSTITEIPVAEPAYKAGLQN